MLRAWLLRVSPAVVVGLNACGGDPAAQNTAPRAGFSAECVQLTCTFTDQSADPDGVITARVWNYGDGTTPGDAASHQYQAAGKYIVTLTVTDDAGATDAASQAVDVVAPASDVTFIGAGDIAGCPAGYEDETTAALVEQYPTATVFTLGDNAYPDGTASDFSDCYAASWGRFKDRTRPAPGNHDYHSTGAPGYFGYYGALAGPPGRGYYSYDLGGWHILSLNSEIDAGATSLQADWLRQDLLDHPSACSLAYWHKPLFTSGLHSPETAMRPLFSILYDSGVDVVLSGHNHQYERFAPQRPDQSRDDAHGIRYFVVGSGGAALYEFPRSEPNSEVRYKGFGVLRLTLAANGYHWEFLPVPGATFRDAGTGECH
jgi:PKD repeat protein